MLLLLLLLDIKDDKDDGIKVDTALVDALVADALETTTLRHDDNDDNLRKATLDRRDPTAAATAFMMFLFAEDYRRKKECDTGAFC